MKILLINPDVTRSEGRDLHSAVLLKALLDCRTDLRTFSRLPLALPTLAALTPPRHQVRIVDEAIEDIDFDEPCDLVGITAMTFKAPRAYQIAKEFRQRGKQVIMGGIHASVCPDEALLHVNSVVVGEADEIWGDILDDAEYGRLASRYEPKSLPDITRIPPPRYDLTRNENYFYTFLQTSRGCLFNCDFCSIHRTAGTGMRFKTPAQVINEMDSVVNLRIGKGVSVYDARDGRRKRFHPTVVFTDDNFAANRQHAIDVCKALIDYQSAKDIVIPWFTQLNSTVGMDDELLDIMSRANCVALFIGFESLDRENLDSMHKPINTPENYRQIIRNVRRHGMEVAYSTIVGAEHDTPQAFRKLLEFLREESVFYVLLNLMTPYPGTRFLQKLESEGRIINRDWAKYNIKNAVFRPARMSPDQLQEGYSWLCGQLYGFKHLIERSSPLLNCNTRLRWGPGIRLACAAGMAHTVLVLFVKGKVPFGVLISILVRIPWFVAVRSVPANTVVLPMAADYDAFARSELSRFRRQTGRMPSDPGQAGS